MQTLCRNKPRRGLLKSCPFPSDDPQGPLAASGIQCLRGVKHWQSGPKQAIGYQGAKVGKMGHVECHKELLGVLSGLHYSKIYKNMSKCFSF